MEPLKFKSARPVQVLSFNLCEFGIEVVLHELNELGLELVRGFLIE